MILRHLLAFLIFSLFQTNALRSLSTTRQPLQKILKRSNVHMSLVGKASFLIDKSEDVYLSTCLRRSIDASVACLKDNKKLIEVEFPPRRTSDVSVTQTLTTNTKFLREFSKTWSNLGKDLWIVFPDPKECSLARKLPDWGDNVPFTMTSIAGVKISPKNEVPKLMIAVNPGFNVEEWIELAKLDKGAPMIIINGNLDRLRSGYYPRIFYPALYNAAQSFYSQATQAFFLSPIAVSGNRFGSWLTKVYPGEWEVLVRDPPGPSSSFTAVYQSEKPPEASAAWNMAKKAYNEMRGDTLNLF